MEGIETQASSSRKEIKFDLSESFEITTDNKIYELKISYNEQLMFFEIKEKNAFLKDEFNLYTNLKELGDINRFFIQFETIKQVFNTIKKLINKKNISIIQEEKKMKIKIINPIDDEEFFINVNSKEKDTKSEINSIIACVNSLTQKVQNLENKVNILENKVNELIKEKEEKKKKKELYGQISKSSVINKDEIDLFMNWFDKKPTKIKLLLDSKIDGDSTQTFYNKCSYKFPTVVFVKTTKGRRFGGYCSIGWENANGNYKKDINNFIFSLDKKKKYKIKQPEYGIQTYSTYFAFGNGNDFYIYNNCTSNNNNYSNNNGVTYETTERYELNGEQYFTVSSYEVYQIEY